MLNIATNNKTQYNKQPKFAQYLLKKENHIQTALKQRIFLVLNKIANSKQHINEY